MKNVFAMSVLLLFFCTRGLCCTNAATVQSVVNDHPKASSEKLLSSTELRTDRIKEQSGSNFAKDAVGGTLCGTVSSRPVYPKLAKAARVQGKVVLHATIDRAGNVGGVSLVSGHPWLVQAAMDAVKKWKYKPYSLDGKTVAVETTIEVNFTLSGG